VVLHQQWVARERQFSGLPSVADVAPRQGQVVFAGCALPAWMLALGAGASGAPGRAAAVGTARAVVLPGAPAGPAGGDTTRRERIMMR